LANSKFVWLVVFENGKTQFFYAQEIDQIILYSNKLLYHSDEILSITKLSSSDYNYYCYKDMVDIEFED